MENKLLEIKAAITAALAAVGLFLGWKGVLALAWALVMCIDYITGSAAAIKAKEWSSKVAREGIWHKLGMIVVVATVFIVDMIMAVSIPNIPLLNISWPDPLCPLILVWYIFTEIGSIIENAGKMGAPVPAFFVSVMKVGFNVVNKAVEEGTKKNE